uniref:WPP domain-containing protein n=1 Tax=Oryza glumipatula TaxID=40148 RepID=A0A0D9ZZ35_9ORYZ
MDLLQQHELGIGATNVARPILESIKSSSQRMAFDVMRISSKVLEGEKGVRAFEELLKSQDTLEEEELYMMNNGISEEAAKTFYELIPSTEKLKVLHFHNNMMGDEDLTELYLGDLNLENKGTLAIVNTRKQLTPQIEVLEMARNKINAKAAQALAECLTTLQSLKKLTLAENGLKDDGAVVIAKALEDGHRDLKELDVSKEYVAEDGSSNDPERDLDDDGKEEEDDGEWDSKLQVLKVE